MEVLFGKIHGTSIMVTTAAAAAMKYRDKKVVFYVVGAGIVSRMGQNPKHDADGGSQTKFRDFHLVGLRVVLRVTNYLQKKCRKIRFFASAVQTPNFWYWIGLRKEEILSCQEFAHIQSKTLKIFVRDHIWRDSFILKGGGGNLFFFVKLFSWWFL